MNNNENFDSLFASERPIKENTPPVAPWKVMVVDDEADFHAVIHLALEDFQMDGRPLELLDANSAAEARALLNQHPDVALFLLDVVMETSQSGLELVDHIRHTLGNRSVRIMVLTGQPGYAPQRDVITSYEIDDYHLKSDLSTDKLFTAVYTSLRNFKALSELEQQQNLLEKQADTLIRWGHIFQHAEWGIFVCSADGQRIELCNPAFARQHGYTVDEVLEMSPDLLFTQEEQASHQNYIQRACEQGHITFESVHLHKNRSTFPVLIHITAVKNNQGQVLYHVNNVQDNTERKQAEEERKKLDTVFWKLQKRSSLGRMAGAIAHNFNNSLGIVLGNLELVLEDLPQGSPSAGYLAEAMKGTVKATEVSAHLLTYLGQTTGKPTVLDLSETCRKLLALLQATSPVESLFEADLPHPGPTVKANANQIEQVLTNLVTNAFESIGDRQGTIHLAVKTVSASDIPQRHLFPADWQPRDNAYACIQVADTGCGIAEENFITLFDPFYSTKFTGRGLGLSTVFGIVANHGGALAVESVIDQGSIFRVFLPISTEEKPLRQSPETPETSANKKTGMVLLVDDDDMLREMLKAMLTRLGYLVCTASDGVEAIEVFKKHSDTVQAVVCDMSMPRMNGWKTVAALRQIRSGLSVILTSGHDESKIVDQLKTDNKLIFLRKPFHKSTLEEAMKKVLA